MQRQFGIKSGRSWYRSHFCTCVLCTLYNQVSYMYSLASFPPPEAHMMDGLVRIYASLHMYSIYTLLPTLWDHFGNWLGLAWDILSLKTNNRKKPPLPSIPTIESFFQWWTVSFASPEGNRLVRESRAGWLLHSPLCCFLLVLATQRDSAQWHHLPSLEQWLSTLTFGPPAVLCFSSQKSMSIGYTGFSFWKQKSKIPGGSKAEKLYCQ